MWRACLLDPSEIRRLRAARERLDLCPLAVHVNYLINLASNEPVIRAKSIASFRGELERAVAIGAEYLILHPGSFRGQAISEALRALAGGLHEAAGGFDPGGLTILIENTAGAGAHLGSRLEELALIRQLVDLPIGFCLDTCHLLAAGFDITTAAGLGDTLLRIESVIGLDNVRVIHANDSKAPLGAHADRHANIGEGHIGLTAFRRILRHPRLRDKPFILETPVDEEGDDRRNMDMLKSLAAARFRRPEARFV